ncbi:MAG: PA14 domain-containing protein [Fimbriimonas sp.]|nr:PA14 domain-containing protein [Fimbriimonas sp.]
MMNTIALALLAMTTPNSTPAVQIGAHYTDGLAGLTVYRSAKESVLLNIGWVGADGKERQGYNALSDAKLRFWEAAPDDSYHRISWEVGSATVTYEWGRVGKDSAEGRISANGAVEIGMSIGPAWPGSKPTEISNPHRIIEKAGGLVVSFDATGRAMPSGLQKPGWSERFLVGPAYPIRFAIGSGVLPDFTHADKVLAQARTRYRATRLWAEGDWGDFLAPIENQLGNSKVYSIETGRLAHIVSRRWCLPDGQVLFCWDSFFNGLLSCLEDPSGAKQTVRAVLNGVTPKGFVPNFSGRGWGTSFDRSQPCVGAMCAWKIYQHDPDRAFLKDVYPKLLRWHKWWFPTRDGNHDGLLEWGSATGDLQNAKFESGLDDSPMFDDGTMAGPNMTLDSTDLSSLWAMDADYLARIADAIGRHDDARVLRRDKETMTRRIDEKLWNAATGTYAYRYWAPQRPMETIDPEATLTANGLPGLQAEYFQGRELKGDARTRQDAKVDFNWQNGPIEGIGNLNFSARWTGEFTAPHRDAYIFRVTSDDGARLWVDDRLAVDAWTVHAATTYETKPMTFDAGSRHKIRLEYFQAEGGAEIHLVIRRILLDAPGEVFSKRLSPLNFYPLIADAASKARGRQTLDVFFRPDKFGGPQVCPTISRDDPAFPAQGYWRGTVWGPTSYLTFLGVRKYATDAESIGYAEKSVRLFMQNWIAEGTCRENFNIQTFKSGSDPHYTWGALMCMLGLEELCDFDADGRLCLNGDSGRHIHIHNLRLGGRLYDVTIEPHRATLRSNGKTVAVARGKVARIRLPR